MDAIYLNPLAIHLLYHIPPIPSPFIRWISPSGATLRSEEGSGPEKRTGLSGLPEYWYFDEWTFTPASCEETGIYKCEAGNSIVTNEDSVNIQVNCK